MSNAVDRMFDNLQARWQTNGGNPFFGRAQQPTMRAAGLISLSTTYRVEAITGDRDEAGISQVLGGDYSEWLARGFLTDEQVADEDGMKDFIADLIAFSEHPDSVFFTSVDFETVGWKPE